MSYMPPFARMRQIRRDAVRPEKDTPAPVNVEAALALVPEVAPLVPEVAPLVPEVAPLVETVLVLEVAPPADLEVVVATPEEEIPTDEPTPEVEDKPASPAEAPAKEEAAAEVVPAEVAAAPKKLVFNNQMNKKDLTAIARAAGWEVPEDLTRAAILAGLTKMNNE